MNMPKLPVLTQLQTARAHQPSSSTLEQPAMKNFQAVARRFGNKLANLDANTPDGVGLVQTGETVLQLPTPSNAGNYQN